MALKSDVVAARTRTARHILNAPDLLRAFKKFGGLEPDLEAVIDPGDKAELLGQVRGSTQAGGIAATLTLIQKFAATQRNYTEVLAVLQAVRHEMDRDGASDDAKARVDRILANDVQVVIRTVEKTDGKKQKVAVKSKSQEAIRAEIQKDATALLEEKDVIKLLTKRGVDAARIRTLKNDASELAGKLAERTAAKGAGKEATAEIRQAVQEQSRAWTACYRILALVAQEDQRVKNLLAEASARG